MIPAIRVNREAMARATRDGFMEATDLADHLVTRGMPFRQAHEVAGKVVLYCIENNKCITDLELREFRRFSGLFGEDIEKQLAPEQIVRRRDQPGGTSPRRVKAALKRARKAL
jgi:argininosuccinate lyase